MKVRIWIYLGMPVLIGGTILLASQPKGRLLPPDRTIDFTRLPDWAGRPLTPQEKAAIQRAIDSIRTPPPSAITYADSAGNARTMPCSTIAADLQRQLNRGDIEAETLHTGQPGETFYGGTLSDGKESTEGDKLNLDTMLVQAAAEDSTLLRYLETVLVHEHTHKMQRTTGTTSNAREVEAFAAGLAYMDSLHFESDDGMRQESEEAWRRHKFGEHARAPLLQEADNYCAFVWFDTTGSNPNYFTSFTLGDVGWYQYALCPTRPSDMILLNENTPVPAGHFMAVICGGEPSLGVARILALDIFQGQVAGTYVTCDFGPPTYPPMYFYSMARCPQTGLYFALDTVNQQILVLTDGNQDLVGDSIFSIYANASWSGFEALNGMRGVNLGYHLFGGFVVVVNHDEVHTPHQIDPYTTYWCLPDMNGDRVADLCVTAHGWEFLIFMPNIQVPLPVEGDQAVQLFATWMHGIEVWRTDSLGQNFYELLGSLQMTNGIDAECPLSRVLQEGEFILPVDQATGARPNLATRVGGATDAGKETPPLPAQFALLAPFPNPFNPSTTIIYDLPKAGHVTLRVFDLLGREVAVLMDGFAQPGSHRITFDGSGLASGIYFVRLETDGFAQTRKLLLVK